MSKRKEGIFSYNISRVELQLTAIQVRPARVLQFLVTVGTGCTWTRQGCNFPEFLWVPEGFTRGFQFRLSLAGRISSSQEKTILWYTVQDIIE